MVLLFKTCIDLLEQCVIQNLKKTPSPSLQRIMYILFLKIFVIVKEI